MSHSCHIWMGHVSYERVMSRMNASCHTWMSRVKCKWAMSHMRSHVTYECVMSHMKETCHIWMRHVTHECVMSNINASCHIWMRHVTYGSVNKPFYIGMSHVTYEWVMSHMIEPVQRVRGVAHMAMMISLTFRAHHEQAFADMVVWFVCSTPSSVTTQKQRKNVTFAGYRHTSLSGRVSMYGSWCTYAFIMANTHMWT